MKKVTSVEWLVEELRKYEFLGTFCTPEELENKKKHVESIVEQAKEMEKEQDRKSTRLNSSHSQQSRMPSSA